MVASKIIDNDHPLVSFIVKLYQFCAVMGCEDGGLVCLLGRTRVGVEGCEGN